MTLFVFAFVGLLVVIDLCACILSSRATRAEERDAARMQAELWAHGTEGKRHQ